MPGQWLANRPGDLADLEAPTGPGIGYAGSDLGYGLKLAHRFESQLQLEVGESVHDAIAGCFACGCRRAATFQRAPVIHDMEWAFTLWGFLGDPPAELVAARVRLFRGASHDYWIEGGIVDAVAEGTLRLTPAQVRDQLASWPSLLTVTSTRL
jgi:hypothetical protein